MLDSRPLEQRGDAASPLASRTSRSRTLVIEQQLPIGLHLGGMHPSFFRHPGCIDLKRRRLEHSRSPSTLPLHAPDGLGAQPSRGVHPAARAEPCGYDPGHLPATHLRDRSGRASAGAFRCFRAGQRARAPDARRARGQVGRESGSATASTASTARPPRERVFSIDTPPPTVSGSLHVGHVFSYTHTDTDRALSAHARQGGLLPDGLGRQRPADRAARAEPLRRALRPVGRL